jgi:hypothetical protein
MPHKRRFKSLCCSTVLPGRLEKHVGRGACPNLSVLSTRVESFLLPVPADTTSNKPEINPEAGDPKPDASGPPSGQPGAQPEASGLPSGQPGDLADTAEPLVGKDRTAGPEEMGDAPSKVSEKPDVEESSNPDRVPFWGF